MRSINNKSGSVLLYSLLIISLITAIAITVSIIVINEIKMTSGAANATLAYYAAESGIEKGLYAVKVYRNDPAVDLGDAVSFIQGYTDNNTFVNGTKYSNEQTISKISKVGSEEIKEHQYLQIDYYDIEDPLDQDPPSGNVMVKSIEVKNEGDNPFSWAEVSWTAWDNQGELLTSITARKVIGPTDLAGEEGWPITLNTFSGTPVGYRIRIKALFGDLSSISVAAFVDDERDVPLGDDDLPSQLVIKSVGERGKFKQSLTATVPWKIPLFGLYDYVLFSEESLIKTIILSREIYTSGAIQVESSLTANCTGCSQWGTCSDWLAVCCAEFVSCKVDSGTDDMCTINSTASKEHWVLPIPDYVPAGEDYYLSVRAKYSTSDGNMRIILGETCKEVPIQGVADEWVSCTISDADFSTISNTNMKFEQIGTGAIDVDWYQLSTYKIFDDCSGVTSCVVPTPDCGNCLCEIGETNCPADTMDCGYVPDYESTACQKPVCSDGCQMTDMLDDSPDSRCPGGSDICCTGACTNVCSIDSHCDDGEVCTTDICNSGGTCAATCDNQQIEGCTNGDGCCPAGCTPLNDNDCVGPPDKEYLRYIARDESGVDLTSLYYSGKSIRPDPTWADQTPDPVINNQTLRRVWAADQNNVWAVGLNGSILHSDDGGTSWSSQTSGTTEIVWGIYGITSSNIGVVGYDGTILK